MYRLIESKSKEIMNLNARIEERLSQEPIQSNEDIVSFYDVLSAINFEIEPFTRCLRKQINRICNIYWLKSNLRNLFLNANCLFITKVIPKIENGKEKIEVYLKGESQNLVRIVTFMKDAEPILTSFDENTLPTNTPPAALIELQELFAPVLDTLSAFKKIFEGIDFSWDDSEENENAFLQVDDGFIKGSINLMNLKCTIISLSSVEDVATASIIEHINESYNRVCVLDTFEPVTIGSVFKSLLLSDEAFMKRTGINTCDLSPLIRAATFNYLGLSKDSSSLKRDKNN